MRYKYILVNMNISFMICFMTVKQKISDLEDHARLFLKAEIKRANLTYDEVAERLKEHGFEENAASIANKLARGTFSATFLIAAMKAIGCNTLELEAD